MFTYETLTGEEIEKLNKIKYIYPSNKEELKEDDKSKIQLWIPWG